MPRRASLPGADLLFGGGTEDRPKPARTRKEPPPAAPPPAAPPPLPVTGSPAPQPERPQPAEAARASRPSGGRPRHDEKITFYCTDSDLTRLEAVRLDLRANHRLASDRGRIIRAAIAEILDDFDARGPDSALVKRLSRD